MTPYFQIYKCKICDKQVQKNAEFCSLCRRPYELMKERNPKCSKEKLIKLTRTYLEEQQIRRNELRKRNK